MSAVITRGLASMLLLPLAARAAVPLTYASTIVVAGTSRGISFQGRIDGTTIAGTVVWEGTPMQVRSTLGPEGSVSGTVTLPDGTELGTFSGKPGTDQTIAISYELGGKSGTATVPAELGATVVDAARSAAVAAP